MAVTSEEGEIGKRIRLVRKEHGVSQRLAAIQMGISRDQLNRIERGEVAVRLEPALRFCEFTNRNPVWLACGADQKRFGFFWPKEQEDGSWILLAMGDDWVSDAAVVESAAKDLTLRDVIFKYKERFNRFTRFFATSDTQPRWSVGVPPKRIGALFLDPTGKVNRQLTNAARFGDVGSIKLQQATFWPALRERIRKLVRRRGMKSALARDIGVSRQAINSLLRKQRPYVPSAEYALRLSKWVEITEAQQKQSTYVLETRARKTRRKSRAHRVRR